MINTEDAVYRLHRREIVVPMIPDIEGENDTSYFEEYDDEDEHVEHVRRPGYSRQRCFALFLP